MTDKQNSSQNQMPNLPRWIRSYLSREDLDAIESKIEEIEQRTAGEIVLLITRRSFDWKIHYPLVVLSTMLVFFIFFEDQFMSWFDHQFIITGSWAEIGLKLCVVGFILLLSHFISKIDHISRMLTPQHVRRKMAEARAELEFFRSGIKETRAATGILVFLAFEDRQAVVLADKAIAAKLPADTWDHILEKLLTGIKSKKARAGVLKAVEMSGAILEEHFPIQPGDTNELKNHIIIKD